MIEKNTNKDFEIQQILDYLLRIEAHYSHWYQQVSGKFGESIAKEMEKIVREKTNAIKIARYCKIFEYSESLPIENQLKNLTLEKLVEMRKSTALNWLAFDGIWFQEVELKFGMADAKFCNDNAWSFFSPFEVNQIKKIIQLPENSGLSGLKMALEYRLYADVNKQSVGNETSTAFDFFMNECRVQLARNRKGMDDYPCKSAGIIEYTTFAHTIDSGISTSVISCPPDNHPKEYYCGWRFSING